MTDAQLKEEQVRVVLSSAERHLRRSQSSRSRMVLFGALAKLT